MPSFFAALVTTGSMIALACIGPGDRCCERGGVLVITARPRQRIASGCQMSEAALPAERWSPIGPYGPLSSTMKRSSAAMRPSLRNAARARPTMPVRARPM
jgi:hypothetical protein